MAKCSINAISKHTIIVGEEVVIKKRGNVVIVEIKTINYETMVRIYNYKEECVIEKWYNARKFNIE